MFLSAFPPRGYQPATADGNRVQVRLKGVGGDYTIGPSDIAVKVTVVLGDAQAAADDACGETAFVPSDCDFTSKHDKLHCR